MDSEKRKDVPETISDREWGKAERAAARDLPACPWPWDPRTAKLVRMNQARANAASN